VEVMREPIEDDLLPLSKPIVGTSGKVYTDLPVPKGTMVTLSAFGYNMYVILNGWPQSDVHAVIP